MHLQGLKPPPTGHLIPCLHPHIFYHGFQEIHGIKMRTEANGPLENVWGKLVFCVDYYLEGGLVHQATALLPHTEQY